jgi:protein O-GlcNAc transferase
METITDRWQNMSIAGNYQALADETAATSNQSLVIIAALWHAGALRALSEGDAANRSLLNAAKGKFTANASEVAQLAEMLVQCAYYEAAGVLAERLKQANTPHGDYIWTLLWREREDWGKLQLSLDALASHGEPWASLARIQKCWALISQGQIAGAADMLAPFAAETDQGIQKLLARIDIAQGRLDAARSRLETIAKQQPLDWEWPCLLAAVLGFQAIAAYAAGNTFPSVQVFELFELGLKRQPRQSESLYNRARIKLALADTVGAGADCNAALALKPWFDAPALLWVERAVAERDYAQATRILENARHAMDTPRRAGAALDLMRLSGQKTDKIICAVDAMMQRFGKDAIFLRSAGAAMQAAKKLDRAAVIYSKVLALAPEDAATRNNLAMLYRERGDIEEAVAIWRSIDSGANETVRLNLAHALLQRGDTVEAEGLYRAVLDANPKQPSAMRGMAEIKFVAGEDDAAWSYALESVRADTKNPLAWNTAAGIAKRREGDEAAVRLLTQGEAHAIPVLQIRMALFHNWRNLLSNDDLRRRVAGWCNDEPGEVEYWMMAATAALDDNDFDTCEEMLKKACLCDKSNGSTALIRYYIGRDLLVAAQKAAKKLVRDDPDVMRHWGLYAEVLYQQERVNEALKVLNKALQREPTRLSLVRQKVGILLARERFDEAIDTARSLLCLDEGPQQVSLLTGALTRAQRSDEAVVVVETHLAANAQDRTLRLLHASTLRRVGRHDDALHVLTALYGDEPGNIIVIRRYVHALAAADRLPEAVAVLRQLAEETGERPDVVAAVGELLRDEGEINEARRLLDTALEREPMHLELWMQRAEIEKRENDTAAETTIWREVLTRFAPQRWAEFAIPALVRLGMVVEMEQALNVWRKREPKNTAPWWAAFIAAKEMKKDAMALGMLNKIEALRGSKAEVFSKRASIFSESWKLTDAINEVRKAIALCPSVFVYYEQLLNTQVKSGNFDEFDSLMNKIEHLLGDHRYSRYPGFFFNINCHPTWSAAQIWRFYRDWYERAVKPGLPHPRPHLNVRDPERKLRIGYVSPDFRGHVVAYFTEPLMIGHDREQFELFAYAHLEPNQADEYTNRFKSYFHHWTEIRGMSDNELERRIRSDGIDILIDLAGHTSYNRLSIFTRRPAPLQVTGIFGAGQTSGLPQIDYLLSDSQFIPPEHAPYLAEKLWRLPRVGMPYRPPEHALDPMPLPCLESGFVTFGVMARPLRTNHQTVAVWAEILKRVPDSRLRFDHVPYAEPDVQQRLIGNFAQHGVSAERLDFRNTRPHWQAYQEFDLQLDPFPASSGSTALEGLYMERLAVTLISRPPAGRGAYVMQVVMGVAEVCSAVSPADYVDKAVALAGDHVRLAELSAGLRRRMQDSWLMDYKGFGRDVAEAYRQMWREWCEKVDG